MNYDIDPTMGVYSALDILLLSYAGAIIGFLVAILVLEVIADWQIFKKAKQPGWACLVPFYNSYIMYKITWGNGWLFLVPTIGLFLSVLVAPVSIVISILLLVFDALCALKLSEAFGHRYGYAIGLYFLPQIFKLVLAFSNDEYKGIPIDGTSYRELKDKIDDIKANEKPLEYEEPEK